MLSVKFHKTIAKPFVERADRIEKNLAILKTLSQKSVQEIKELEKKYNLVKEFSIPKIEAATGYKFSNQNLFLFVFLYQEINKVFKEAQEVPGESFEEFLIGKNFADMKEASENRLTLAYIGDAALEIGVLPSIWPHSDVTAIPRNEILHNEREKLIKNEPLSRYWESLQLYDSTILIQPPNENSETKGSYMEAVFGIIYLESGLEAVENALKNVIQYYETKQVKEN